MLTTNSIRRSNAHTIWMVLATIFVRMQICTAHTLLLSGCIEIITNRWKTHCLAICRSIHEINIRSSSQCSTASHFVCRTPFSYVCLYNLNRCSYFSSLSSYETHATQRKFNSKMRLQCMQQQRQLHSTVYYDYNIFWIDAPRTLFLNIIFK